MHFIPELGFLRQLFFEGVKDLFEAVIVNKNRKRIGCLAQSLMKRKIKEEEVKLSCS